MGSYSYMNRPPSSGTIKSVALGATILVLLYILFSSGTPSVETESNFDKESNRNVHNSFDSNLNTNSERNNGNQFVLSTLEETMRNNNNVNPKFSGVNVPTGATTDAERIQLALVAGEQFRLCVKFRTALFPRDYEKLFANLETITEECRRETEVKRIKLSEIRNSDEVKHHVYSQSQEPSVVLTLGVGADTDAEDVMKKTMPKGTEFFFADPIVDPNAALVKKFGGTFFPVAVGAKNEEKVASLRKADGGYESLKISHVDMTTFMTTMVNRTRIDHLLLDNEGPEYQLIPLFLKGGDLDKLGVTICQMNVEFHKAGKEDGTWWRAAGFENVWTKLSEDGQFQPLLVKNFGHLRAYFVNMKNSFCVEKYAAQFF